MVEQSQPIQRKVLIASANPLFAKGLQRMFADRPMGRNAEVRLVATLQQAFSMLDEWQPDLVIVDYDDQNIQRDSFLSHFIASNRTMQVMLVSLRASGQVVVYDRRMLTTDQAEDWLELPWTSAPEIIESYEPPRSKGMKHFAIVGAMTAVFTVVIYALLTSIPLLPIQASVQAGPMDRMVYLQLGLIAFLFALITSAIVYSIVVFRGKKGDTTDGPHVTGSTRLEILWTVLPLALVIYLSFIGAQALGEVRKVDTQALKINVTSFQWGWSYEYPDYGITTDTLYMPQNKQAQLLLTSRDVIHSFWVPEFRVKQDALPGKNLVKEVRITPTELGEYQVMCAEMCGGAHAYMVSPVKVVTQADFDAWVDEETNAANASPAQRGERLARTNCIGCHSLDGTRLVGPTWKGAYGSQIEIVGEQPVIVDDAYLHESIVDPNAKVHETFAPGIMPSNYATLLTEQQIADMIEFIKTVK